MALNLPPIRKGPLKVGGMDGQSHGRVIVDDDREHCTCGWVSEPLPSSADGPIVWCDHLVADGVMVPWEPLRPEQSRTVG